MVVGKHLIFQKVIVSYLKDADNDIMFTMKVRVWTEMASSDEI